MREYTRAPFFLIGHDWGAIIALKFQKKYPQHVLKLALFDVGIVRWHATPLNTLFHIVSIQLWWALAYAISQAFSSILGDLMFKNFNLWSVRLPLCPAEDMHIHESDMTVSRCYPYYHFYRSKLLRNDELTLTFPTCPLLFMVLLK